MTTQQIDTKTAEGAAAAGAAAEASAQNGIAPWIAESLKDAAKAKEFARAADLYHAEDFTKMKDAATARERSLQGKLSAADAYQKLTDEQRAEIMDAQVNREEAIAVMVEQGVPKDMLDDFPTAKSVRAFGKKYIAANGGGKKAAAPDGKAADVDALVQARLAALIGGKPASEAAQPGTKGGGAQVANIETLADGEWNPKAAADFMRASGYRS